MDDTELKVQEAMKLVSQGVEFHIAKMSNHVIDDSDELAKIKRLERLIELNYAPAYGLLGEYYYFGSTTVNSDYNKALKYLEKGAEREDSLSLSILADYYDEEKLGNDKKKAFDYAKRAYAAGDMDCCAILGDFYEKGEVTKKDLKQAIECYKVAQASDWDTVNDYAEQRLYVLAGEYWTDWVFNEDWTVINKSWEEIYKENNK